VLADGQTDTHTHTQTQTDFIICTMLYAIAMGQITRETGPGTYINCAQQNSVNLEHIRRNMEPERVSSVFAKV